MNENIGQERQVSSSFLIRAVRFGLPGLVIVVSVALYFAIAGSGPKHSRRRVEERTVMVEIMRPERVSRRVQISANGIVVPSVRLVMQARVNGEVSWVSPELSPGGRVKSGDLLLRIDPVDYQLSLVENRAKLAQAEYACKLELGQQEVAKLEWKKLPNQDKATQLEKELTLRTPHLKKAMTEQESAQAGLKRAELNLERTEIRTPFNAVVLARGVEAGSQATTQTQLAVLAGTDEYWIDTAVSADKLQWIEFPVDGSKGSSAEVSPSGLISGSASWNGDVIRLLPGLEEKGRLARLIVRIANPLDSQHIPLLIDSFVKVLIQGKMLDGLFVLPSKAVHDGNTVWIYSSEEKLEFRTVEVMWSNAESVTVRNGLSETDTVVLTNIASPLPGLRLKLQSGSGVETPRTGEREPGKKTRGSTGG
ncbi:MAG: efflux RND transporter periplasmic adaptor subunit [Candidatus Wallbacteria bacterium]|nr:efflux RND transporter periplasmic adaptor subunit [Candidatus Wallbacteria bacterium]